MGYEGWEWCKIINISSFSLNKRAQRGQSTSDDIVRAYLHAPFNPTPVPLSKDQFNSEAKAGVYIYSKVSSN